MDGATEKIYCCGDRYNNDALYALLANQRNENPMALAAMMNNCNNWQNNPFIYLVWMMFAQRMWGGDWSNCQGQQNIEVQSQLQAIRSQMQDNQNSSLLMDAVKGNNTAIGQLASNLNCDFNALQGAICDVRGGIDRLSGQVGFSAERVINSVQLGNCNLIQSLKDCCCATQKEIISQGYQNQLANCNQTFELRNGQRDLGQAITQGFSATAFQAQQDKCDIIRANQDNTQRIIDTLNGHWSQEKDSEIQDLKFQISQERQNRYIAGILSNNSNCGCNCGCGCGCGF